MSVANSAAVGVVGEINDVQRAVIHMGATRARSIAMAFALNMMAKDTGLDPEISQRLWVNSLEKAYLAQTVAEKTSPPYAQAAYAIGLIQDIGLSALWAVDTGFYTRISPDHLKAQPLHQLELEHFGIDHAVVGHHLLTSWHVSPLICEQVLDHHQQVMTQKDASATDLANMIAGMLPHDGEPMTPDRMEWLDAVHGQFLAGQGSPDKFIKNAVRYAKEVHRGASSMRIDDHVKARMLSELAADTAGMVRQLCEMENLLTKQHEQVNALEFEAMTDPLTQLLNRRGFSRLGDRRLHTSVERSLPVCAIAIDLDGFKQVNDTHGHEAGDQVLAEVARLLRANIDSSDLIGRLGGDEFAIFLMNVSEDTARQIAERVASACVGQVIPIGGGATTTISFSIGVTTCRTPTHKTKLADLLTAADEAMYTSKRAGKGGITVTEFPGQKKAG